jgi:hypothetical protein
MCPYFNECRFMAEKLSEVNFAKNSLNMWIETSFCHGGYDKCARYMVADIMGAEKVPSELYPTRIDKATAILQTNSELASFFL